MCECMCVYVCVCACACACACACVCVCVDVFAIEPTQYRTPVNDHWHTHTRMLMHYACSFRHASICTQAHDNLQTRSCPQKNVRV